VNLLDNAADTVNGGGELSIRTARRQSKRSLRSRTTVPVVATEIMRTLATRVRNVERYSQEREKLAQLGAMAAGLARELNNPATAARRAAAALRQNVESVHDYACELNQTLSVEQWQQLVATSKEAVHCTETQPKLNPLDAWDLAPVLVSARIDQEVLDILKQTVPTQDLENAIRWLVAEVTTRDLLKSITHSTERISELVQAVKSDSFMDQARGRKSKCMRASRTR
jgi:signal transduction histidine kinase